MVNYVTGLREKSSSLKTKNRMIIYIVISEFEIRQTVINVSENFEQSWQNDSHYGILTRNSFVSNSFLIFLHSTLQPLLCKSRPVNFETNLIYGEQKGRSAFTINLAPSSDSFVPRFRTENKRPTVSYVRTNRAKLSNFRHWFHGWLIRFHVCKSPGYSP